jgi:signal transduction histidine kinase
MKHELKRYNCRINLDSHVDMNTEIMGEVSNLVQVFDNIIVNAIQSYGDESGDIDFKITGKDSNIVFSFQDYGSGIPQEIQLRLFKEMLTTKGKDGTGLGLYMSYSIVRGRLGGNMWFESALGKGTTFYISIPCNSKSGRYQEVLE